MYELIDKYMHLYMWVVAYVMYKCMFMNTVCASWHDKHLSSRQHTELLCVSCISIRIYVNLSGYHIAPSRQAKRAFYLVCVVPPAFRGEPCGFPVLRLRLAGAIGGNDLGINR